MIANPKDQCHDLLARSRSFGFGGNLIGSGNRELSMLEEAHQSEPRTTEAYHLDSVIGGGALTTGVGATGKKGAGCS